MQASGAKRGDEDIFEFPAAWRRHVQPRRGGVPGPKITVDSGSAEQTRRWIAAEPQLAEVLGDSGGEPQSAGAAYGHAGARPAGLDAATLAAAIYYARPHDGAVTLAGLAAECGLPFAAQVVAEWSAVMEAVSANFGKAGSRPFDPSNWPPDWDRGTGWLAGRVRARLAAAAEEDYQRTIDALAGCRRSARQRILVSFMVPTRTDWVNDCCAEVAASGLQSAFDRRMLLCALGNPGQLAVLGELAHLGWDEWSLSTLATLAEGVGSAIVPILGRAFEADHWTNARKLAAEVLSALPTDQAFQVLLENLDQRPATAAVLVAMTRYPVRALRLLAAASADTTKNAQAARGLLDAHLLGHPELVSAVLPDLPEASRRVAGERLRALARIGEAPAADLPALLISPPWSRPRVVRRPVVMTGLVAPQQRSVCWHPGEREEWAQPTRSWSWHGFSEATGWDAEVARYQAGGRAWWWEVDFFVNGPEELLRPLVSAWYPAGEMWGVPEWLKPIVAKYELGAFAVAVRLARKYPAGTGPFLLPFLDVEVARLMADWLDRLKSARAVARAWLARHGGAAARLLVPDALGQPGPGRAAAEAALRYLAGVHGAGQVLTAAESYGTEAAAGIKAVLAADPLQALPKKMPVVGEWADPALLPQIRLRDSQAALPAAATAHVITMLALSGGGEVYPGIDIVREACDPGSLASFGWGVFQRWQAAGSPARDGWALSGLGLTGNDETVRRLTPLIRSWPGEGGHQRAVAGLDVLAAIGTEIALMHLNAVAQRVKFKALKLRAQEKIAEVAEGLGLSEDQLADRLVPDFGLDERGTLMVDYGPRRFAVGFDEQLKPHVSDEAGHRRKDLPTPGARDDAELAAAARKRYADLKKDVRMVAADQIRRLESAMVLQRRWPVAEFRDLLAGHPLMWHIVRRLVWVAGQGGSVTEFRVAEDRTYGNVDDDETALPAGAEIGIAHPLLMGDRIPAWSELFADYEILQPFPQLGRPVYRLNEEEAASSMLTRFENRVVPTGKILGLTNRGWERGGPQDAGMEHIIFRRLADDRYAVIELDPGIAAGLPNEFPQQTLQVVGLDDRHPEGYWTGKRAGLAFGSVDPVMASELLSDLTDLVS